MANAILEAINGSSTEEKREALAALERELYGPQEETTVGNFDPFVYDAAGNVLMDENDFPVLKPEVRAEIERRVRVPGETMTLDEAIAFINAGPG